MSAALHNPAEDNPASSAPAQTLSSPPPRERQQQHPNTTLPPSATPTAIPTTSTSTSISASPYESFHAYPFATDAEFKLGLGVILGNPAGTPATEDEVTGGSGGSGSGGSSDADEYAEMGGELLLKAKIFYFSKKFPSPANQSLTPQGYKTYLQHLKNSNHITTTTAAADDAPTVTTTTTTLSSSSYTTTTAPQEPSYPTPFAHIVDLITNNQPIPGIQDIPDTLLTGKDKPSVAARRRKPWEVVGDTTSTSNDTSNESLERQQQQQQQEQQQQ
ncbi:hypothetical protein AJ78_07743 [Emergomyces pasteurianus Ep9510]|uniref:Uncharacterized protein n=1 Tax=Emergomyces pasteurianus Ep9510 TaxID=1447872 RepID=A0A1J9P6I4_9EURO|nr:hypothetical protein AJ78_07743 [Emergomyces pasteurianus Ep9510]